ncbi:GNAT family N-acetyltransferase [Aidingimonas lacisalsi]|uniref:GNAT family N-acetyltransferase n=1 Tax=Aidingimonas lacisalsi TaxID=2604086 RepID=UPI0011D2688D|nr:N-acetyltransferase [Aidingimonas lacisalsi]
MNIRTFQDSDFDAIAGIYSLSKLDEFRYENGRFELLPLEKDEERLREMMESRIFVYDDGGILGYGAVLENEIQALYVHPLSRGRGIGKRLLEHLISQTGASATLYVAKNNVPAKVMYQKYDFMVTKEFETSYNGTWVLANEMVREAGYG